MFMNSSNHDIFSVMDSTRSFSTNIERELNATESNGLLYLKHGTNITVICLLPNHPALKSPIESVNFFQKQVKVVGKGKKVSSFIF